MKKCIWCSRTEQETSFHKLAHTIPQALGGKNICENVCDQCNSYFGQYNYGLPPIETVLKETFNISRIRLAGKEEIGKNKTISKVSSIYFNIDHKNNSLRLKNSYKFHKSFQEKIARQMKRGIYKIFLEETERQFSNGHDEKFNFIREFARYNIGDYPIFYFTRGIGAILFTIDWIKNPEFILDEGSPMQYIIHEPSFVEFEFFGHVMGIATSRNWEISYDLYEKRTIEAKKKFFKSFKPITSFNDFDLSLSILDDQKTTNNR